MKRCQQLNRQTQFLVLHRDGVKIDTASFRVVYRQNRLSRSRFATIVNRKFGTAVKRNQAKRRARSLFDRVQKKISPACDLLVYPKNTMLTHPYAVLVRDFEQALKSADLLKGPP
jgi:ribonuclease P protein component